MKRLLFLSILGISINASAQVSISTRADSIKAINDRQITTSVPPNLVYPVQVGAKTDSLCALIKSLVDTVNAITGTTLGLQQVTDNLDTTSHNIIVGSSSYRTTLSNASITTNIKPSLVLQTKIGVIGSTPGVYIKDASSSVGFNVFSAGLTGLRYGYLPNEGTLSGGIASTFVLHHTANYITVDAVGTGDSTHIGQGYVDVYAPPVSTYNLFGSLRHDGLFIGERNAAHTHQDGMNVYYGTDGSNYNDTIQNKDGTFALLSDMVSAPADEIIYGTGSGTTSYNKFKFNSTDGLTINDALPINFGTGGSQVLSGTGDPTGITAAPAGSIYLNQSVGAETGAYINIDGTNTGWGAIATNAPKILFNNRTDAATTALSGFTGIISVGASDATLVISANINIVSGTAFSFTVYCSYKNESNNTVMATMSFTKTAGTPVVTITNATGSGSYEGTPMHIRCKAGTPVAISTTGTFTDVVYNADGIGTKY